MTIQANSAPIAKDRSLAGPWLVAIVGSCIGLAIMGDSLMYTILPLAAPALGIPLPLVGILLSANRFVRLLSNSPASRIFEGFGPRLPFLGSMVIGAAATILYGVPAGFILFLIARLLWGIAWSGLRQGGYVAIWTGVANQKGRLTGLLWGLVRLGSAVGVLVGGILYDRLGYHAAIVFVIVMATTAVPVTFFIRWGKVRMPQPAPVQVNAGVTTTTTESSASGWRAAIENPVQRWLVISGFFQYLLSGVVVSTTAVFLAERVSADSGLAWMGIGIATLTGMMHGVRWISDLLLGPIVGALSDRIGQAPTAACVAAVYVAALFGALLFPPTFAVFALFLVLLADGAMNIVTSAAVSGVAMTTPRPHAFVGVYTTTTDAGSALGPLVAYSLVTQIGLPVVYSGLAVLLLGCVLRFWRLSSAYKTVAA